MKKSSSRIKARQLVFNSKRNAISDSSSSSPSERNSSETEDSALHSDDSYYDENDNMEMLCMTKGDEEKEKQADVGDAGAGRDAKLKEESGKLQLILQVGEVLNSRDTSEQSLQYVRDFFKKLPIFEGKFDKLNKV